MFTATTTANFARIDTAIGNFKAIGYAYSYPCGDDDFEAELTCEIELSDEVERRIADMAHHKTNCNVCNKSIKVLVIVQDVDNDSIHVVGRDCGNSIDSFGMAKNRVDDKSARAMKMAKGKRKRNAILSQHDGLKEAFEVQHSIIQSIRESFVRYDKLSPKQIALIFKLAKQQAEFDKANANAKPIDFSKALDMPMEVVSVKEQMSAFGEVTKVLLKDADGRKLYGNLTASSDDVVKGDKISLTSNSVKVSGKDKSFGFFSRAKIKKV